MDKKKTFKVNKLAIIGVGLMGGSIAAATKRLNVCQTISAYDVCQDSLKEALAKRLIDSAHSTIQETIQGAELIILATPVGQIKKVFAKLAGSLTNQQIITDVCSVKTTIISDAQKTLGEHLSQFVPGHPIAGSQKSGIRAACEDLFNKQRIVLIPNIATKHATNVVTQFWENLDAKVLLLTPEKHDQIFSLTSHLPQAIAYAFLALCETQSKTLDIQKYTGTGFSDFTRLGESSYNMWHSIFSENKENVTHTIDGFIEKLKILKQAIMENNQEKIKEIVKAANDFAAQ